VAITCYHIVYNAPLIKPFPVQMTLSEIDGVRNTVELNVLISHSEQSYHDLKGKAILCVL